MTATSDEYGDFILWELEFLMDEVFYSIIQGV